MEIFKNKKTNDEIYNKYKLACYLSKKTFPIKGNLQKKRK